VYKQVLGDLRKFMFGVIAILKSFRKEYLPILTIYFASYFLRFHNIAELFWFKSSLSITSSEIVSITIWSALPWSVKIVFGQIIGRFRIFGSARYSYIWIAAFIMLCGNFLTIAIANQVEEVISFGSYYHLLIVSGLLIQTGIVLQDLVADTLCYEVVRKRDSSGKEKSEKCIRQEIGSVQILSRAIELLASMTAFGVGGILATKYSYGFISWFTLSVPVISVLGMCFVRSEPETIKEPIQLPIFLGGLLYIGVIIGLTLSGFKYSQEAIFCIGVTIVGCSLYAICRDLDGARKKEILYILLVVFTYKIVPSYSPGVEWWQIDVLGFSPKFFSRLSQINVLLGFIGLWLVSKHIINREVGLVLFWLNILHVILQLPMIGMSFGLHEWTMRNFGFGAETIALVDTIAEGPFDKLVFLVLTTVATYYAPKKHVATWFALVMSLMSLSLFQGSRILKRILSEIFVVERGVYDNIPELLVATSVINFIVPTAMIFIFVNPFRKKSRP